VWKEWKRILLQSHDISSSKIHKHHQFFKANPSLRKIMSLVVVMTPVKVWKASQLSRQQVSASSRSMRRCVELGEKSRRKSLRRPSGGNRSTAFNKISASSPTRIHRTRTGNFSPGTGFTKRELAVSFFTGNDFAHSGQRIREGLDVVLGFNPAFFASLLLRLSPFRHAPLEQQVPITGVYPSTE
jgi:hypothetical protein